MTAGTLLCVLYWALFTIRRGFSPCLAAAVKANAYDLNRGNPEAQKAAQRKRGPLTAAKWALRVAGWIETGVLILLVAWLFYLIGALITGTFIVFGNPV